MAGRYGRPQVRTNPGSRRVKVSRKKATAKAGPVMAGIKSSLKMGQGGFGFTKA